MLRAEDLVGDFRLPAEHFVIITLHKALVVLLCTVQDGSDGSDESKGWSGMMPPDDYDNSDNGISAMTAFSWDRNGMGISTSVPSYLRNSGGFGMSRL
jgi:hypothetical protein